MFNFPFPIPAFSNIPDIGISCQVQSLPSFQAPGLTSL